MATVLKAVDTVIRAVKHDGAGRQSEFRLEGNPGLVLLVQKTGAKAFWFYYRTTPRPGEHVRRKVRLGAYPATSLAQARRQAAELTDRIDREGDIVIHDLAVVEAAQKESAYQALTLDALVGEYLAERRHLASAGEIERELRKDVLSRLGHRQPSTLVPEDIDAVAREVLARGAPAQARRIIMIMKALYAYCLVDRPELAARYRITSNPASNVGRRRGRTSAYPVAPPRQRALADEELAMFFKVLMTESEMAEGTKTVLALTLLTGQRHGEIRSMQLNQLSLEGSEPLWIIPKDFTKPKLHDHPVPLAPTAAGLIKDALARAGNRRNVWLFGDPRRPEERLAKNKPAMALAHLRATRLAEMQPFTPHDLRRSCATGLRRLGVTRDLVGMILNHHNDDVTSRVYDRHEALPERRAALLSWDAHLALLMRSPPT